MRIGCIWLFSSVVSGISSPHQGPFVKPYGEHRELRSGKATIQAQLVVSQDSPALPGGEQVITDHGDTFLTITLDIGSQKIFAIPDSGSFDLYIVDGDDCSLDICGPAYKPEKSSDHFEPSPPLQKDIYFGSGVCGVEISFDSVHVHNEAGAAPSDGLVPLWRIVEMDEDLASVWGDGSGFQGIVGLGFKGNVQKDARELLLEQQVVLEAKQKTSSVLTKPGMASQALFGDVFAICLPRGEDANPVEVLLETHVSPPSQDDGRLWWGNSVPQLSWVSVPVVGTRHWTVRVSSAYIAESASSSPDNAFHLCGGGSSAPCAALVDSGTSLIAMSESKINQLLATTIVGSLNPDCSNVDLMPDLVFQLDGGKSITLTPDAYVMKIEAESDLSLLAHSGRVVLEEGKKVLNVRAPPKSLLSLKGTAKRVTYCTHAFMETPMETALVQGTEHELIILGIPVFREYSVRFDRKKEELGFALHPFGTTCHNTAALAIPALVQMERHAKIRTFPSKLHDLVFPNEFRQV